MEEHMDNVCVIAQKECLKQQIKEMCEVFKKCGFKKGSIIRSYTKLYYNSENIKTTITYSKFMELFGEPKEKTIQPHYDNTNGSIYKFCNDQKLNSLEFDIIKCVVRCRKKGLFKEDLIDLYLKEFEDEK